jgi:uncharacterized protein YbaR (Trm112 family)
VASINRSTARLRQVGPNREVLILAGQSTRRGRPQFASLPLVSLAHARTGAEARLDSLSRLVDLLRCLECRGALRVVELVSPGGYPELGPDGRLDCTGCGCSYPVIGGTPRTLREPRLAELRARYPRALRA